MKKSVLLAGAAIMMCYFTSCSGGKKTEEAAAPAEEAKTEAAVPEYKLMNDLPTVDLSTFPKDADGKVTLFDGKSFNGAAILEAITSYDEKDSTSIKREETDFTSEIGRASCRERV